MASESPPDVRFAIVIPVFNHGATVAAVVTEALALGLPVFVVDDGSTDGGCDALGGRVGVRLLRHGVNRGKGAALLTGMRAASKSARWAVTLDADGQHHPSEARRLMRAIPPGVRPIVVGCRTGMQRRGAPWTSRSGRAFSNFWVRMAGGSALQDSQSGFRIYPLPEVLRLGVAARRYQFEVEVLVRAAWQRMPVIQVPISVTYPSGAARISHFRPFVDFLRNSQTFTRLIAQRVFHARPVKASEPGKGRAHPR